MIRPHFSNIINDYKTPKKLKVHSNNDISDHETQYREWKIQLLKSINYILSNVSGETRNMHTEGNNIEIMMGSETDEI